MVVYLNPLAREERRRNRADLLAAAEKDLQHVQDRVQAGNLVKADAVGMAVEGILNKHKMAKHFVVQTEERSLTWTRNEAGMDREAKLDGIYVVRASVPAGQLAADEVVKTYKGLQQVEQVFRNMKTMHLELRPASHRREDRVRAHVSLCMLAYCVQWHMMRAVGSSLNRSRCRHGISACSARAPQCPWGQAVSQNPQISVLGCINIHYHIVAFIFMKEFPVHGSVTVERVWERISDRFLWVGLS